MVVCQLPADVALSSDKLALVGVFDEHRRSVVRERRRPPCESTDAFSSTRPNASVEGFRPKVLAVRPVRRASNVSAALFRQHVYVLFTLLGLSLPYRIWFARHCDETKVNVVKEVGCSAGGAAAPRKGGSPAAGGRTPWFRGRRGRGGPPSAAAGDGGEGAQQESYRSSMQSLSLYGEGASPSNEARGDRPAGAEATGEGSAGGSLDENGAAPVESENDESTIHDSQASKQAVADPTSGSSVMENADPPGDQAAAPDATMTEHEPPTSLEENKDELATEPTPEPPTSPNGNADETR